jgi:hypothetical protein
MACDKAEELLGQGGWVDKWVRLGVSRTILIVHVRYLDAGDSLGDSFLGVRGRTQALDAGE